MKHELHAVLMTAVLALGASAAFAQDQQDTSVSGEVPGKMNAGSASDKNAKQPYMTQAKDQLAPHSLMIASALDAAKVQVQGLRSQLDTVSNPSEDLAMEHVQMYNKKIRSDLSTARTHEQELAGSIAQFPKIASSDQFQKLQQSMSQVQAIEGKLSQLENPQYLKGNKQQAMNDLKNMESKLSDASTRAQDFNKEIQAKAHFTG